VLIVFFADSASPFDQFLIEPIAAEAVLSDTFPFLTFVFFEREIRRSYAFTFLHAFSPILFL